ECVRGGTSGRGVGSLLDSNKNLTIDGAGNGITVDGSGAGNRVFQIDNGNSVFISGLTITGGSAGAFNGGGGIFNAGLLTLNNSTVAGNPAFEGGGILNASNGTMIMSGDTVNNNTTSGDNGGGINNSGKLTIINCTIAANQDISGGGIANGGVLMMANSTVASNSVVGGDGGGIYTLGGVLDLLSTIVFNPNSGAATKNEVLGQITKAQGNLFGFGTSGIAGGGDLGGEKFNFNPLLGPLQNNGGPTATMALLPGSPALGAGVSTSLIPGLSVPTTDQRGDPRPANSIDIGAFQTQPPPPPVNGPQILSLSPIVEGALRRTLTVLGLGFTPGSVLLVNGRPVATLFLDGTHLAVPRFLRQVQRRLHVRRANGRVAVFEEGLLTVQVLVPGVGVTPAVPL